MAKVKFKGPEWHKSHGLYIGGRAYIDGADETAIEMEGKWGKGRLRLLVGPELREKFDRQRYLFHQAISHGDLEDVKRESGRMVKAWLALDKAAAEAGARTKAETPFPVVEVVLADGTVAVIVPDGCGGLVSAGDDRKRVVYEADEIARLLEGYPGLAKIKHAFPGATVEAVRSRGDPLDAFDSSKPGLDDPIDDLWREPAIGI